MSIFDDTKYGTPAKKHLEGIVRNGKDERSRGDRSGVHNHSKG